MEPFQPTSTLVWEINKEPDSRIKKEQKTHTISDIVNAFNQTAQTWHIQITGNEPFLYPNFVELCYALTRFHILSVSTHFSAENTTLFAKHLPPQRVVLINACLHITNQLGHPGGIKHFTDHIKFFRDQKFNVQVKYLMFPPFFHHVFRDLLYLNSLGIQNICFDLFRGIYQQKKYPSAYNPDTISLLRRYAQNPKEIDLLCKKFFFTGKICSTGKNHFVMDYKGNVKRCSGSSVSYGNLLDGTFTADKTSRPCPFSVCPDSCVGLKCVQNDKSPIIELLREIRREQISRLINIIA